MATWGELEKDTGLGLLGIKERYEALQAEHGLCGGQRRRDLARISELEQQAEEQGKELSQATEQVKDQAEQITELRAQLSSDEAAQHRTQPCQPRAVSSLPQPGKP